MATHTPFELISHTRRVCSLYKRALRAINDHIYDRAMFRYYACKMRQDFEKNKNLKDMILATKILKDGEAELEKRQHPMPNVRFPASPGGMAYNREIIPTDGVLDFWDPAEKALFPDYFKRREERKNEYIAYWEKKYGKLNASDYKHEH